MHYVLFIPGYQGNSDAVFHDLGLSELAEENFSFFDCAQGPDGKAGKLATVRQSPDQPVAYTAMPHWRWIAADAIEERDLPAGRFWFGWNPQDPPRAKDLAKKDQFPGNLMKLGDWRIDEEKGRPPQPWLIPAAARLPHRAKLVNGQWTRMVRDDYRAFYEKASEIWLHIVQELQLIDVATKLAGGEITEEDLDDAPQKVTVDAGYDFCCQALALNYRVTPEICSYLDLLDDAALQAVIAGVIDGPAIAEHRQQKKSSEPVAVTLG